MANKVLSFLMLAGLFVILFVFLYNRGYMVFKSMSAVTFIGSARGNGAKFSSCDGYMKRVIRFREDGSYAFSLDAQLSKGDISVQLTDSSGETIMELDCTNPTASISARKKEKYCLTIHFRSATGRYALIREQINSQSA